MNTDNAHEIKDQLIDAMLRVAASHDWGHVTMIDIAAESDLPVAEASFVFEHKDDVVAAFGRRVDAKMQDGLGRFRHDESCKDRLFDVFMERYDILAEDRAAVRSLITSVKSDPARALTAFPHLTKSVQAMMEFCEMETKGVRGAVRLAALSVIYMRGLLMFLDDQSHDMDKLMARLDQDLSRAEMAADLLSI